MEQVISGQRTDQPSKRAHSREDFNPDYSSRGLTIRNDSRDVTPDETIPTHQDVMQCLVKQWAEIAVRHAMTEPIEDPDGMVATIAWINGPWAFGQTAVEALNELESVLIDWVTMKLEDGDRDIPNMEGVYLVVDRDEP